MCGIFGVYDWSGEAIFDLRTMAGSIAHRGPDAEGIFSEAGIAFGNRRLSVIDISEASNQPLYSADEDIVVVQNGAIYNYIELRQELTRLGHVFRTKGDTEVLLHAFLQWGPDFVQRLNGMFAIAIYQKSKRKLWLFRDRLGVKPLYISGSPLEGKLWFASEIKAILTNGVKYNVNLDALSQFMALNYVPPPQTMFERIVHLPAGHWAVLCPQEGMRVQKYWSLDEIEPDEAIDFATAQSSFMALLDDATRIRLRADAPFGAFLSGGLDSASVVAMMSLHQRNAIRTYSVGFDSEQYDETKWARLAARRFGTLHHTMAMEPNIESDWERFIWHCDQPHGDVSFIPLDQISAIAAQDVKMVLTGDGGDELWGGVLQIFGCLYRCIRS
ncbi:asparagine synthase (glutamine-hydrolyzing), partial [Rhodobacteraceae bacterium]|nr:asparagine synthase (glutamine-hydrolyzing) [Paracoccaceae bacterium]